MKPWGYGVVALVMADAWGEEVTQHVRRGHIFGASPPSVAVNICFRLEDHSKNLSYSSGQHLCGAHMLRIFKQSLQWIEGIHLHHCSRVGCSHPGCSAIFYINDFLLLYLCSLTC